MFIEDPITGNKAEVSKKYRLKVSSKSNPRSFYVSRDEGKVFNYVSSFDATTGAILFSLENNSSTDQCYVSGITFSALTNCSFDIHKTLSSDTPSGTTLTAVNMNFGSANVSEAEAFGNTAVSGITNTTTTKLMTAKCSAYNDTKLDFNDSLILQRGNGLNIALTGNGVVDVSVNVHFEDPTAG